MSCRRPFSNGALLERGSDRAFERWSTISSLSPAGWRLFALISAAAWQSADHNTRAHGGRAPARERGISVGAVAHAMHVSSAFIASESGKMRSEAAAQTLEP